MDLIRKDKLQKLKKKKRSNKKLCQKIDQLIDDIENALWSNPEDVKNDRPDADCVHTDGFYFFDIEIHRTMVLLEFSDDEATVVWVGSHDNYETTFKNNKDVIEKWLRSRGYID